jgi:hypothetical protein
MTDTIDLTFEFDPGTDPDEATARVLAALRSLPYAETAEARPQRPMSIDPAEALVTVIAMFTVARGTVHQLDALAKDLTKLAGTVQGLRRALAETDHEQRVTVTPGDGQAGQ